MNTTKVLPSSKRAATGKRGFGLVELITVIAVIGVLGAIAIPAMAGLSEEADIRRCQRIAQEYSLQINNAIAAGNEELMNATTVAEAIELISKGVKGTEVFEDAVFKLPGVSLADRTGAAYHLSLVNGAIIFDPR